MTAIVVILIGMMLCIMLAKSRKKGRVAPPKGSGDLPWFLTCREDKWLDIEVHLNETTLTSVKNEKDWSCYKIEMTIDGDDLNEHEVPFWTMDDFYDAVLSAYEAGDDTIELRYRRSRGDGGINIGEFREA